MSYGTYAKFAKISIVGGSEWCFRTGFMQVLFFIEHLGTSKTISTVLYKNDKGIKLDSCLKPAYMWLFTGHILAAGKAFKVG